jgi:hypothetical protein
MGTPPLRRRLAIVQTRIGQALDAAPPGLIRAISLCAGDGRDLLGVLEDHPRREDVSGRLVELDPVLAARARGHAPRGIDVLTADASRTDPYVGWVPADLVLVCGVFGQLLPGDIRNTIRFLRALAGREGRVVWTRSRRPPDRTIAIRRWFAESDFEELTFERVPDSESTVGVHRYRGEPVPLMPGRRIFRFRDADLVRSFDAGAAV